MKLLFVVALSVFVVLGTNGSPNVSEEDLEFDLEIPNDFSSEDFGIIGKLQCKLCKEAMRPIAKEVNRESSKEEIKKVLDKACSIIPLKKVRRKCHDSIAKRGDQIAEEIAGNFTPDNVCRILQFC